MNTLKGRVALITGASAGIGLHSALALARNGAIVGLASRRLDVLEKITEDMKSEGLAATPIPMDVTKRIDIENGIRSFAEANGRLDILVNSSGISLSKTLEDTSEEDWDVTHATNVKSIFWGAKTAAKEMEKNRFGRIINISSIISGGVGCADTDVAAYASSKAAVIGLTEALAIELASVGILVNAIAPGYIETNMTESIRENPQLFQALINRIPLKRFGKAEEIANIVAFLASEQSSYITGTTIYADGGWLAG